MGKFQIKVIGLKGDENIIDLCHSEKKMQTMTVLDAKKKIITKLNIKVDIRMVFTTEPLEESSQLQQYGIRHMSTIHVVARMPGGI
uniref:Ubiquitin-like domain-containing protein n=1 Tax=Anabas testudineus TaxID=64144 RepID=A0A3Q1ICG6_ANATE